MRRLQDGRCTTLSPTITTAQQTVQAGNSAGCMLSCGDLSSVCQQVLAMDMPYCLLV